MDLEINSQQSGCIILRLLAELIKMDSFLSLSRIKFLTKENWNSSMEKIKASPRSIFMKSKQDFVFMINKNDGVITHGKYTVASQGEDIKIYLNGVIYNNDGDQLIAGFLKHGVDFVSQLEGSFIIFLVIGGKQFYILTDKVNSKKAYYGLLEDVWYVSTNIDLLPIHKCHISLDGVACYLANGVMLNDLTLFQEISSAHRACITGIINNKLTSYHYWDYKFDYSSSSILLQPNYQDELKSLLIDSIKRRFNAVSETGLSLSAGYDSRGILGILHGSIRAKNISCFSYALLENPKKKTDASNSKLLAVRCGYDHQIIKSYNGNLMNLISGNAREGKCLSNFCDEIDAWHYLAANKPFSDIFVGDECFGWVDGALSSKEEILDCVSIKGASSIMLLGTFISQKTFMQMVECLNRMNEIIFESTSGFQNPHDKKDFLYLDQRINHVLMPWRENFLGQVGYVHNPYLDGAILEFMKKMPPEFRKNKFLFEHTINNMFPDLFSLKRATSSGSQVNLRKEFHKFIGPLISLVQGTDSRLDDIISKKEIIGMIKRQNSIFPRIKVYSIKILKYLGRRNNILHNAFSVIFRSRYNQKGVPLGPDILLLRVLLIRVYLSRSPSDD
jgi:asparagine synthase (glutamine-hydrolysing)